VRRTGEPQLVPEITAAMVEAAAVDDLHLRLLHELGLESYICVPLVVRGRPIGAFTFVIAESGRRFDEEDLALAEELARRASTAVETALLYGEAEERAQAARVLASVADGVFLLDGRNVVRLWNPAAEAITGLRAADVLGRPVTEVMPAWEQVASRILVATAPGPTPAETVPLEIGGRELWLSISGVGFDDGTVYAFRDLTEERKLEELKTDFVATISHELRTPLAAIYGAAVTIRRIDLELDEEMQDRLLEVIADESERLARIVNDVLLASNLDSGALRVTIESCDAASLARGVIESAAAHVPDGIDLDVSAPEDLPRVAADPTQLRQVLVNLVDNAIKYSPEGGPVELTLEPDGRYLRFAVRDRGLGIPSNEQRRIFEKFYRLDPNMTRGIGGTGLGLYICRELVRRVGGRIWVESEEGVGSTFFVDIPLAEGQRQRSPKRERARSTR
jgi:two-component system phosphate regulon sensor histidine kinase PhoR